MDHLQNLHTHTTYTDGKDTPEALVLEAIARGFESLGFSEHSALCCSRSPKQLTADRAAAYKSEIAALKKKYAGQLELFCGLEFDFHSEPEDALGYDYCIGSVHCLELDGGTVASFDYNLENTLKYIDVHFGGDGMAFAKAYYETLARLPERGRFDIIGHIDIVTKNNELGGFIDTASKTYLDAALTAIHALRGKIPFFEVNTGAISRGYRTAPYPQIELLRELRACGFGALITSDCHNKDYLDHAFPEARELLLATGFTSKFILTANGFAEVAL